MPTARELTAGNDLLHDHTPRHRRVLAIILLRFQPPSRSRRHCYADTVSSSPCPSFRVPSLSSSSLIWIMAPAKNPCDGWDTCRY
ncbi:hypothetical protein ZIOFF_069511 [Zingiber officinale]|uniref:Uncharacterized protein n=1 Tax=Zingiber officinale TaxID=94328 RepID=A0A8J5EU70_ZINOF|nr:hypothetical protein ZIOFF_069511 [Zingiber officinale]